MTSVTDGYIVDPRFNINGTLVKDNKVYTCVLNQTDIKNNKNKFYIMQLIKSGNMYIHAIAYGRTGEKGKIITDQYTSEIDGKRAFEKQFRSKTGNQWTSKDFIKKAGKYFLIETSYADELKGKDIPEVKVSDSKLDPRVQYLLSLLSDVDMMHKSLISLDIDTKKLPLGKINKNQLDLANTILDKIQGKLAELEKNSTNEIKSEIIDLSSEYYTYVPIACGRKKPPVINSNELLTKYKDTIDELKNMVINVQIANNTKVGDNPLDTIYDNINTNIVPLDKTSVMWNQIIQYVKNTHGKTHRYNLEVLDVYEIKQLGKKEVFDDYCKDIDNRTLLFHGSGMSNWLSIMKNDLLLNPQTINNNIVITGKMFGYGLYFANAITKSFGYCRSETSSGIACLALAEVALGHVSKRKDADYYVNKNKLDKLGMHSVQGIGQYTPENSVVVDDITIPNGKLVNTGNKYSLLYDEFIVYDGRQQHLKYLVIVKDTLYK